MTFTDLSRGVALWEADSSALDPSEAAYCEFVATHDWIDEDTPRCVVLEAMATRLWSFE